MEGRGGGGCLQGEEEEKKKEEGEKVRRGKVGRLKREEKLIPDS